MSMTESRARADLRQRSIKRQLKIKGATDLASIGRTMAILGCEDMAEDIARLAEKYLTKCQAELQADMGVLGSRDECDEALS